MPRPPRLIAPGMMHHVTVRGNDRQATFLTDLDYRRYLRELARCCEEYTCELVAYALMPNHIHLVLQDQAGLLSKMMQVLNACSTRDFNYHHHRIGHLYQGRFHARRVDRDAYLLEVTRYVHLNPVRAQLVERPEDYPWSSYRVYVGLQRRDQTPKVSASLVWSLMSPNESEQPARYRRFVEAMTRQQLPQWETRLRRLKLLGSTRFAAQVSDTFTTFLRTKSV